MATYVNDLRLKEIATGDESGTWGTSTNTNLELIANAMGLGAETIPNASTHTITMADGTADEFRSTFLRLTGGGTACTVTLAPNTLSHTWIMRNETAAALTLTQGSGANVTIAAGQTKIVSTDGGGAGAIVYEMDDLELAGNLAVTSAVGINIAPTSYKLTVNSGATTETTAAAIGYNGDAGTNLYVNTDHGNNLVSLYASGDVSKEMRFLSGSLEVMRLDTTGNVGIGLTNAADYYANNLVVGAGSEGGITIASSATTYNNYLAFADSSSGVDRYAGLISYDHNINDMHFRTNSLERMRIDASGNVGIGSNTPVSFGANTAGLTVNGSSGSHVTWQNNGTNVGFAYPVGNDFYLGSEQAGSNTVFTAAGAERMRIDSSGNVGIGGNPIGSARLGLSKSSGGDVFILTDTSSADLIVNCTSGVTTIKSSTGTLALGTGNAEKIRIDSSGRLLVNTTSPLSSSAAKLQVLQTVTDEWSQRIGNSAGSPYGLAIDYSAANPNNNVNFFIYCTSSNGAKFGVHSNGGISNYSGFNINLSDRNAKKDITIHTDNEWDCVKAWEIVDYRYKDEADDSPAKIGVIAQQIQEHCPDLVNVFQEQADAVEEVLGEDGEVVTEAKAAVEERIGVNEAQMMWKVTKALQEAMERIETLEAKVQTLENN